MGPSKTLNWMVVVLVVLVVVVLAVCTSILSVQSRISSKWVICLA